MEVTPEQFEAHLRYLVQHADVVSLDTLLAGWEAGRGLARPAVAITFDDAYRDVLEFAAPLLDRYACPATVFVPPGFIDTGRVFWWELVESWVGEVDRVIEIGGVEYDLATVHDKYRVSELLRRRLTAAGPSTRDALLADVRLRLGPRQDPAPSTMSWREIRDLSVGGQIAFGPHTVNHFAVSRLDDAELAAELTESCRALAERVSNPSAVFAYPYGRYADLDPRPGRLLRELGCRGAVTLVSGPLEESPSPFALRRIFIDRRDDVWRLRAKLSGVDAPFWALRRAVGSGDRLLPACG
jgi:peptidoglycan/xylan/chitin deacetylase (PgdA/CDA1 family)